MHTNCNSETMNVTLDHENSEDMSSFDKNRAKICRYIEKSKLCDCLEPEHWKELRGQPRYFLCADGNIVSCKTKTGPRLMKPYYNRNTGVLSHSFGPKTKGTAKLVLEHFHPSFLETGGQIKYKDKNRQNVKLSNLNFETFQQPGAKAFWDVYYQVRWERKDVSEDFVKVYFDHIIDRESVNMFCRKYSAGYIPEENELQQILEQGWIQKYGTRRHTRHEIPLGQIKQFLKYLVSCASELSDSNLRNNRNISEVPLKKQKRA